MMLHLIASGHAPETIASGIAPPEIHKSRENTTMYYSKYDPSVRVYLTDDEDILARCAVGVFRPTRRVHLSLGTTYADLSEVDRSAIWAFERLVAGGQIGDDTGVWIYRGIGDELSYDEDRDLRLFGCRVLVSENDYEVGDDHDYERLVDDEANTDHGWARFVHIPASSTALAA